MHVNGYFKNASRMLTSLQQSHQDQDNTKHEHVFRTLQEIDSLTRILMCNQFWSVKTKVDTLLQSLMILFHPHKSAQLSNICLTKAVVTGLVVCGVGSDCLTVVLRLTWLTVDTIHGMVLRWYELSACLTTTLLQTMCAKPTTGMSACV